MIYCVEDEKNIRELLIYTLETTGFSARGMANSKELKDALKEELPDLILLDIMLPGEDGYSILERLKASSETQNIPVIMVTAKEAEYDKVRGLEAGADDYITKPFGMMEFVARVKAVLRRCSRQEEDKEDPFVQGMEKVYKHLLTTLEGIEVKPIEAVGQPFDPNFHNAVMHVEDENFGENIVAEEFQKGYTYRDSVVRHSMVKVAN